MSDKFRKMLKHFYSDQRGVTLIELTVSVGLFVILIIATVGVFETVIDGQRNAMASQNVQENLKYFFEVMSKEIRMAQKDEGVCDNVDDNSVFSTNASSTILYFKNYHEECVTYELETDGDIDRFKVTRDANSGFITPQKVNVTDLKFVVDDDLANIQSLVTVKLDAESTGKNNSKSRMTIQTTLSSRYYE